MAPGDTGHHPLAGLERVKKTGVTLRLPKRDMHSKKTVHESHHLM